MAQLPILHSHRAAYDWVEKLRAMREAYEAATAGDPARVERDARALDAALVYNSLRLKGADVTLDEVRALRPHARPAAGESGATGADDAAVVERARHSSANLSSHIANAFAAVERVRSAARAGETLTPELLLEINRLIDPEAGGVWRTGPGFAVYSGHQAPPPEPLPELVETASGWFAAESFTGEFHAVEQAALAFIRICDLQPFPSNNEFTARVAISLFTLRAGWPPVVVREAHEAEYRKALLHALNLDTGPIVELLAASVIRAYDDLLGWNIHDLVDADETPGAK